MRSMPGRRNAPVWYVMNIRFISRPNLLLESIELVYRYIRGDTSGSLEQRIINQYNERFDERQKNAIYEYISALNKLFREAGSVIDAKDDDIERYFARYETGTNMTSICLAKIMTFAFADISVTDFDESVLRIKERFKKLTGANYSFCRIGYLGFIEYVKEENGPMKSLKEQVDLIDIPNRYKWDIFKALSDFDNEIDRLADLLRPVAEKLDTRLGVFDGAAVEREAFWHKYFSRTSLARMINEEGGEGVQFENRDLQAYLWRIACDCMTADPLADDDRTANLYIGMLVEPDIIIHSRELKIDLIQKTLHILGNKKRLEIIHLLKNKRLFGFEIATRVGLDATTVSRHLAALSKCGMITAQKGEGHIIYYTANKTTIKRFFNTVYRVLMDDE